MADSIETDAHEPNERDEAYDDDDSFAPGESLSSTAESRTASLPRVRKDDGVSISTVVILFLLFSTTTFVALYHYRSSRPSQPPGLPDDVIAILENIDDDDADEFFLKQVEDYQESQPEDYPRLLQLLAPLEALDSELGRVARVKASELRYRRDLEALKTIADLQHKAAAFSEAGNHTSAMATLNEFPPNLSTPKWERVLRQIRRSFEAKKQTPIATVGEVPNDNTVTPAETTEVIVELRELDDEHFVRGLELIDSLVLDFQFQEAEKVAGYLLQSLRLRTGGAVKKRLPQEYIDLLAQRTANMSLLDKMLVRVVRAINLEKEKELLPRVKAKFRQVTFFSPRKIVATRKGMMRLGREREQILWRDFNPREFHELASEALDRSERKDALALSLFLLEAGVFTAAEHSFRAATKTGIDEQPYVALFPLRIRMHREIEAEQVFRRVQESISDKSHQQAKSALLELKVEYVDTHFVSLHHGDEIGQLERRVDQLLREEEAGQLWAEAKREHAAKHWVEARFNLSELAEQYATTEVYQRATAARPSWKSMLNECNQVLAKVTVVRKDGKGDFATLRTAITDGPAGKRIEIHDNEIHSGVSMQNRQLTLFGAPGYFPTVRGLRAGANSAFSRMRIVPGEPTATERTSVIAAGPIRFTQCVLHGDLSTISPISPDAPIVLDECILMGAREVAIRGVGSGARLAARFSVFYECGSVVQSPTAGSFLENSIVSRVGMVARGGSLRIRFNCLNTLNVTATSNGGNLIPFDAWISQAGRNSDSFRAPPRFRDTSEGDFRLNSASPCKRKASDAGDLGVRWKQSVWENVLDTSQYVRGLLPRP